MLKVLSLGWGVQSFTLAAMSALGDLEKLDFAISADTRHEKAATYDFIARWTPWLEDHGIFIANVATADDRPDNYINEYGYVSIPAFATDEKGESWLMRRQCTADWKIWPVRRFLDEERVTDSVELWFGISVDEFERAKDSDARYLIHRYPLLELDLSREQCAQWLLEHNLEIPPRSACYFCPYTYLDDWHDLARNHLDDFERAAVIDEKLRDARPPHKLYLNRFHIPLRDLSSYEPSPQHATDAGCDSGFCFT